MKTELEKLIAERDRLREKERQAYERNESRAKRTSYTFKINDVNARIELERKSSK